MIPSIINSLSSVIYLSPQAILPTPTAAPGLGRGLPGTVRGGDVCLYVKNSTNYLNRDDLDGDNVEALFIEILKPLSASFIVGTIFIGPQVPLLIID